MHYTLDQLETFVAVVRAGSFSAAARRLGKTQSTVSAAISNLEIDLGVELFDRSRKWPVPTDAGARLLRQAELVLERCLDLDAHARNLTEATETRVRLAIDVPHNTLMEPLTDFAAQFPYVDLDVRHAFDGDVSGLVQRGEVAMGIAFAQRDYPRELAFTQMGKLILVHVVRHDHPLAGLPKIDFVELRGHRRLMFLAHNERLPSTEYLESTQCWRAENYPALLEMVRAGLGWTTLPRRLIRRELETGELVELPLAAYPHTDWVVGIDLVWQKSHTMGRAGVWLLQRLRGHKIYEKDRMGHPTTW
ncbi:LysR family transcriptional regulator [Castellaniella sp. MT123]|uniref:LysR family transcriptional regulator n=1 Tax=Castellaniella sp. MT123 TaxID=3140381 RepID=UPI0031F3F278